MIRPRRHFVATGPRRSQRRRFPRLRRWLAGIGLVLLLLLIARAALYFAEAEIDRVDPFPASRIERFDASSIVVARDGTWLRVTPTGAGERRIPVALDEVSPHVIDALLVAEDRRFFRHGGVDMMSVVRAAATGFLRGRVVSGASTLTMQLARQLEPRPRTLAGKAREAVRARQLERALSKREILEAYLNLVPWGGMLRGVESASRRWFGKPARELAPDEAAMLVAMLPAPSRRSPIANRDELQYHRDRILHAMFVAQKLTHAELQCAVREPIVGERRGWPFLAPHACDHLLDEAAVHGECKSDEADACHARVIETTLDLDSQRRVEWSVRNRDDAGVDGVAVVVLDREDESILAMLGSRDYRSRPLNVATRRRATGSTLKPFLYALAIADGFASADGLVLDAAGAFGASGDYRPENYDRRFRGRMPLAEALAESRNLPAVRLLDRIGGDRFRHVLQQAGLHLPATALDVTAALGTIAASPLELARAYTRLFDPSSQSLGLSVEARARVFEALSQTPPTATPCRGGLAWKTGTSNGLRDAWCVGVTRHRVIVVWLGNCSGTGHPNLVGRDAATSLMAEVAAAVGT